MDFNKKKRSNKGKPENKKRTRNITTGRFELGKKSKREEKENEKMTASVSSLSSLISKDNTLVINSMASQKSLSEAENQKILADSKKAAVVKGVINFDEDDLEESEGDEIAIEEDDEDEENLEFSVSDLMSNQLTDISLDPVDVVSLSLKLKDMDQFIPAISKLEGITHQQLRILVSLLAGIGPFSTFGKFDEEKLENPVYTSLSEVQLYQMLHAKVPSAKETIVPHVNMMKYIINKFPSWCGQTTKGELTIKGTGVSVFPNTTDLDEAQKVLIGELCSTTIVVPEYDPVLTQTYRVLLSGYKLFDNSTKVGMQYTGLCYHDVLQNNAGLSHLRKSVEILKGELITDISLFKYDPVLYWIYNTPRGKHVKISGLEKLVYPVPAVPTKQYLKKQLKTEGEATYKAIIDQKTENQKARMVIDAYVQDMDHVVDCGHLPRRFRMASDVNLRFDADFNDAMMTLPYMCKQATKDSKRVYNDLNLSGPTSEKVFKEKMELVKWAPVTFLHLPIIPHKSNMAVSLVNALHKSGCNTYTAHRAAQGHSRFLIIEASKTDAEVSKLYKVSGFVASGVKSLMTWIQLTMLDALHYMDRYEALYMNKVYSGGWVNETVIKAYLEISSSTVGVFGDDVDFSLLEEEDQDD